MPTTLSVKSQDNAGVTYANPAKPDTTVRFRFSGTTKSLGGIQVPNYATEVIVNDNNEITVGDSSVQDALSVRLRVSGALASKARLRQLIDMLTDQLMQWETENVMQGFRPSTAPVIPDAA